MFKLGHAVDPVTYGREVLDMFNVDGSFVYDKQASFSTPAADTLSEGGKSVQEAELESSPHMMGVDYELRNNYMPKPYGMDEQFMQTYAPKPYGQDFTLEQENMPTHGYQQPMMQLGDSAASHGIGHGAADDEGLDDEKGASLNSRLFKLARVLGDKARANLPKSDFARPSKGKTQSGSYPMPDPQHARSAVGFCEMHHPGNCGDIRAKAQAKFGSSEIGSRLLKMAESVITYQGQNSPRPQPSNYGRATIYSSSGKPIYKQFPKLPRAPGVAPAGVAPSRQSILQQSAPKPPMKAAFLAGVQDEPENHRSDGLISPEEMYPQTKAKVSQAAANYRPASGPHSCATCAHFDGSGTCSIVEGHISPSMVSDYYEPGGKTAAARQAIANMIEDDSKPSEQWDGLLVQLKKACGGDCTCPCNSKAGDGKSESGGADPKQLPERENLNRPNKNTTSEPHAPDAGPDPKQLPEREDITTPGLLAARQKAVNARYKNADSIVNNAIEAGYTPLAAAFLARTLLDGMDEPQIKQAAAQAIGLHEGLRAELEPIIKTSGWGDFLKLLPAAKNLLPAGGKALSKGKGLFGFGDDALRAARNRVLPSRVGMPGGGARSMGADPRWSMRVPPSAQPVGGTAATRSFNGMPGGTADTTSFVARGPFHGPVRPPMNGLPPRGTGAPPLPPGRASFNGSIPGPGGGGAGGGGGPGGFPIGGRVPPMPPRGPGGPPGGAGGGGGGLVRSTPAGGLSGPARGLPGGNSMIGPMQKLHLLNHRYGLGAGLAGESVGLGVDALGDATGLYDTNGWGGTIGGLAGMGVGSSMGRRMIGGRLSKAIGKRVGQMATPAFVGSTAYGIGQGRGQEKLVNGVANEMGMTPEELMSAYQKWGPAVSAFNHGDIMGAMGHGWNALDPQTQQSLLLGGGGALLGGLAGGTYGGGAGALGGGLAGGLGGAMLPHLSNSLYGGGGQGMGGPQEGQGQGPHPSASVSGGVDQGLYPGQLPDLMGNDQAAAGGGPEFNIRDELAAQGIGSGNMAGANAGVA